jgi:hypothetical protein
MPATIIHARHDLDEAPLAPSPPYGYLLVAASVAPPTGPPFVRPNATRRAVVARVADVLDGIATVEGVVRATGYRAVLIPPARAPEFRANLELPRFDLTVLVETDSPASLPGVGHSDSVASLREALHDWAIRVTEMRARCLRAIADVDKPPTGTYLFNYWAAPDPATALEVWERLAPWFRTKTGLRNSTVLQSVDDDGDLAFVNHARWDARLMTLAAHQFLRPSFYGYVRANLAANRIQVYPALYHRI